MTTAGSEPLRERTLTFEVGGQNVISCDTSFYHIIYIFRYAPIHKSINTPYMTTHLHVYLQTLKPLPTLAIHNQYLLADEARYSALKLDKVLHCYVEVVDYLP